MNTGNIDIQALEKQQLEALYRSLEGLPDFVVVTNLEERILFANSACLKRLRYTAAELLGQPISILRSPRNPLEQAKQIHEATLNGGWAGEVIDVTKDGEEFIISVCSTVLCNLWGQPIGSIGVSHDITARRRAEIELDRERRLLRALLDNIPDTIYFKDTQSRFTLINGAQARLLGLPDTTTAVGRTDADFFPAELAQAARADEERVLTTREPVVGKLEKLQCPDGQMRWVSTTKVPIIDGGGAVTGMVGISRDVTQEHFLQQQMIMSQKLTTISSLTGGIAHEFNNLLLGVAGHAELLLKRLPPGDPARHHVELIRRGTTEAAELTKQLSVFSRSALLQGEPLNVNHLIVRACQLAAEGVGRNVMLENRALDTNVRVRADAEALQQAVLNIVHNACEAMPHGGRLIVNCEVVEVNETQANWLAPLRPGRHAVLTFSDTGAGMDQETCARVFEPFFTTKRNTRHSGLGLTAAYSIIEVHGGLLRLNSQVGRGTTVTVYLPLADDERTAAASTGRSAPQTGTVLLVEDEEIPRLFQSEVLAGEGFRVVTAANGEEGMSRYREFADEINLIVTDILMPQLSGDAMLTEIRKLGRSVPVLAVTGYTLGDAAMRLRALGVDRFLQKPFTSLDLVQQVRQLLALVPAA